MKKTVHYTAGGDWLQKSTHLLIAGATGSGKSNALHVILQAATSHKEQPFLALCDPKRVELALWRKMEICRGACDWLEICDLLDYIIEIMEDRYRQMESEGITQSKDTRIIVVIDELADLMSERRHVFLPRLQKLLRLGRAARISVFAATQDPSRRTIPAELVQNGPKPFGKMKEDAAHFGMGLYSSHTLCLKHGGNLKLKNENDHGATVTASFQIKWKP